MMWKCRLTEGGGRSILRAMQARSHPSECSVGDYVRLVDLVVEESHPFARDGTSDDLYDVEFRGDGQGTAWKFTLEEVSCDGGTDFAWVRKS